MNARCPLGCGRFASVEWVWFGLDTRPQHLRIGPVPMTTIVTFCSACGHAPRHTPAAPAP